MPQTKWAICLIAMPIWTWRQFQGGFPKDCMSRQSERWNWRLEKMLRILPCWDVSWPTAPRWKTDWWGRGVIFLVCKRHLCIILDPLWTPLKPFHNLTRLCWYFCHKKKVSFPFNVGRGLSPMFHFFVRKYVWQKWSNWKGVVGSDKNEEVN